MQSVCSSTFLSSAHSHSVLISNPQESVTRACYDVTTSNLQKHIAGCATRLQQKMGVVVGGGGIASTYTPARLRAFLAIWLASSFRPYALVNDVGFQDILRLFDPHVAIPSQPTVGRDIKEMYFLARSNLAMFLEVRRSSSHSSLSYTYVCIVDPWEEAYCNRRLDLTEHSVFYRREHIFSLRGTCSFPPPRLYPH